MNVLREGNKAEDRVDIQYRDTMFSIDHKANYVDFLHHPRKRLQGAGERLGPSIDVKRKLADHLWVQW